MTQSYINFLLVFFSFFCTNKHTDRMKAIHASLSMQVIRTVVINTRSGVKKLYHKVITKLLHNLKIRAHFIFII